MTDKLLLEFDRLEGGIGAMTDALAGVGFIIENETSREQIQTMTLPTLRMIHAKLEALTEMVNTVRIQTDKEMEKLKK